MKLAAGNLFYAVMFVLLSTRRSGDKVQLNRVSRFTETYWNKCVFVYVCVCKYVCMYVCMQVPG